MREFQARKRLKKYLYSKVTIAILVLFIVIAIRATWGVYGKEKESAANALEAQNQLIKLQDRQTVLTSSIDKLNTDEGVEEAIRSKYGVSKPDEKMIVIVNNGIATITPEQATTTFWGKIKSWFK